MSNCNFYISYCRADGQDIAVQLGKQLTEKGYSVFIDKEKLVSGSDFAHNIADAISNCDYFVPIITDATSKSQSAMNEIYFAFYTAKSRATKVIPIVVTQELDSVLQFNLGSIPQIRLDQSVDLSTAVTIIVDQIDKSVGYKLQTTLLYEKLSEYKKLGNNNKEAASICDLIKLVRERCVSESQTETSKTWTLCEELLNLYKQLSNYVGSYNEESRNIARKIMNELDATYGMLRAAGKDGNKNIFQCHILYAAVAIRIIYYDRVIRKECADTLTNGEAVVACPISVHIERQKEFVSVFNAECAKTYSDNFEEPKRVFIKETRKFVFSSSNNDPREIVFEKEVYNVLIKCGYKVDCEFRLDEFIVDLAIKKNGRHVLYIECVSALESNQRMINSRKKLADYIESTGGKLYVLSAEAWANNPRAEVEKIRNLVDSVSAQDDEILVSIAKFIQEGNKLFDILQKNGVAGDFLECLRESYERLMNYCKVVGADEVAAECAERIVEIRNSVGSKQARAAENERAEKGIKSLLGYTLENSGKYDVFISFKNEDSDLAERIYEYCHKKMKVPFWSKKTLPRLSKSEYSKAIDFALDNSKHFVVVVSDLNYLNAEWIQYEMDVFNNEIKEGRKKDSNFIIVATDKVYDQIIQSNKSALGIAYRRYQIIKMSEYEENLGRYFS